MSNQEEFPLNSAVVYLNHAAVAPWPRRTCESVSAFANENVELGATQYPQWLERERILRQQLVELLNAESPNNIALVKNTSEALSFVAYGLDWKVGDSIVISDQEFPSNRIVWESLASKGVRVIEADISGDNPEADVMAAIDQNTRLLSISSVQYASGLKLDLNKLGRHCRDNGVLFCVDAIQSVGAHKFDVQADYIDFAMADGHKWMLGPEGLGFFYVRPACLDLLKLTQYGWHMIENQGDYDQKAWQIAKTARRFECGSPNMLAIHGLSASLSLLLEVGMERVECQLNNIVDYLIDQLSALPGLEIISAKEAEQRAGIVTFRIEGMDMAALHRGLMESNVICAHRGGGIRFSPHFYTTSETIDRAIALLREKL